jgi:predicted nuclease of predicted toxin-antitoxin system
LFEVNLLADECCDAGLVSALRVAGHDVTYVAETLSGSIDEVILATAHRDRRILMTEDKDFGELVYRLRKPAFGILLLRFSIENRHLKVPRMSALLGEYVDRLPRHFVVLDETKFRFRPLLAS